MNSLTIKYNICPSNYHKSTKIIIIYHFLREKTKEIFTSLYFEGKKINCQNKLSNVPALFLKITPVLSKMFLQLQLGWTDLVIISLHYNSTPTHNNDFFGK